MPLAHNAAYLVQEYRAKLGLMYNMWVNLREGVQVSLEELRLIYGPTAYAYKLLKKESVKLHIHIFVIRFVRMLAKVF